MFGFYLPGYNLTHHLELLHAYAKALSDGTWRNKKIHLRVYLAFCGTHQVDPLNPTQYDVLSFLLHLASRLKAPGSVFNYFSSVKTWFASETGAAPLFESYHVRVLKRGIKKNTTHVVTRALPLAPDDLKRIVCFLGHLGPDAYVFVAALLIGYLTMCRQSNLVCPSIDTVGPHTLLFHHVHVLPSALRVCFTSTKTRTRSDPPLVFSLPAIPHSPCCPRSAWLSYASRLLMPPDAPAFVLPSSRFLTVKLLARTLSLAAAAVLPDTNSLTLHSIRRGAAHACYQANVPLSDIKSAGSWRSNAVNTYLSSAPITRAPAALSYLLG